MGIIMHHVKFIILSTALAGFAFANPTDQVDGHFSSWTNVSRIIDSITGDVYRKQLKQLHQLTRIKLGYSMTLGGASHPLSLEDTQKELRRLYTKSKAEQD
jgi:hypothetical protein